MPAQFDNTRWVVGEDGSRTRAPYAGTEMEVDATEAAAEFAAEHGVDLTEVAGTGAGGRITKQDVEDAVEDDGE